MNRKSVYVIAALFCAFLIAGCILIYGVHYDYGADASLKEDGTIDYSVTSSLASDCSYVLMSDTDFREKTYLYLDDSYESFYSVKFQKIFFKTLIDVLDKRGYHNVEYVNSKELKEILNTASAKDSIIIFTSGSLPDTVYSPNGLDLITSWFEKGGEIYWAGPNIGSKMSTPDGITDTKFGLMTDLVSDGTSGQDVKNESEFSKAMYFSFKECTYGLKKNCENSLVLGYTSDDYSSASVVKYLNGRIIVIGGDVAKVWDSTIITCAAMAGMILTGITENTKILTSHEFHKETGSMSGHIDCYAEHGDVIYFMFGVPYSTWSKAIVL